MNKPFEREKAIEGLVEALIKMLGKSNEKVDDLTNRVIQLEFFLRESVLREDRTKQPKGETAAFPN